MKKLLIIILFLFLLCGCKNEKDLILGISRIDESKVCEEYCTLDLKIISSQELENVYLDNIYSTASYDYQISSSSKEVRITGQEEQKIYGYDLHIRVFQPTTINSIDLEIDRQKYTFDIGTFKCLNYTTNTMVDYTKEEHLQCVTSSVQELNSQVVCHNLQLVNMTDRTIIIGDIILKEKSEYSDIRVCRSLDDKIVHSQDSKTTSCYVENAEVDLCSLGYVIEVSYVYKGELYYTYFEIGDTSMVEAVSDVGSYIAVEESCFVLKN